MRSPRRRTARPPGGAWRAGRRPVARALDPDVLERALEGARHVGGDLLVRELEHRPVVEEARPAGVLRLELLDQVPDRAEVVARLRALGGAALVAPRLRLHRAPEGDRLAHGVAPPHPDVARAREERGRIVDVAPHQLGAEDAVGARAPRADAREMVLDALDAGQRRVGRRLRRRGVAEQRVSLAVVEPGEEVAGRGRAAGGGHGLEVLLRAARDAGRLQPLAQQRAAAAGRRTDEIGDAHAHRLLIRSIR